MTGKNKKAILFVWVFFLFFTFTAEWVSVSSDSVEAFNTPQGIVSHLRGNVVVTIDETVINGSEGLVYEAEGKAIMLNFTAYDEDIVISGDTLTYYREDDKIVVTGKVKLKTPDEIIHADTLIYLRREKKVKGKGNLRVVSLKEDTIVMGGQGEYDLTEHSGTLVDSPVFIVKAREDTKIESEFMHIDQEAHMASAVGNVNVSMRSGNASCDSLQYDLKNEIACMWSSPRIEGKNEWVIGDTIEVFFNDREIVKTLIAGSASGKYELSDGRTNFVKGDTIEIIFDQGEMKSILVKGSAQGEYIEGTED